MSEILPCPVCGEMPRIRYGGHLGKEPVAYSHCGATFDMGKRWNQYASAMNLAKLTYQMKTCRAYCPERAHLQAQDRILETFDLMEAL